LTEETPSILTVHFRDGGDPLVVEAKSSGFDQIGFLRILDMEGRTYGIPSVAIKYYESDHKVSLVQGNFPKH
jgi:hypothetical protein